jgi:cell division protease FtsH
MTTGAGNDIEQASDLARKMVCEFGMSSLGPIAFGKKDEQIFLGREIAQHRDFSEDTAIKIDQEVSRLVDSAYGTAREILQKDRDVLIKMAEMLLDRESTPTRSAWSWRAKTCPPSRPAPREARRKCSMCFVPSPPVSPASLPASVRHTPNLHRRC